MTGKRVLIIEDDKVQSDDLKLRLQTAGLGISQVDQISTELAFRRLTKFPYDAAVVDMMLRWTDPAPEMIMPPKEILDEGFYVAGLRCCRKLKQVNIPCVIFTALDPNKIPLKPGERFEIINKSQGHQPLIEALGLVLSSAE
jgi:CheY-like chemotaxis protein